jgi:UDP-glucose 4-epimerase
MRYLITGGAGFVGSHITDALVARGDEVLILDNLSTGRVANLEHLLETGQVRLVEGSVTDADLVDRLMRRVDRCLHLASAVGVELVVAEPLETLLENVRGIDVVLEAAARRRKRLLFTSTSEVYGKRCGDALSEESDLLIGSPARSRWSYAIAKSFGEAVAHGYAAKGAEVTVVRLFNAVGPRQSARYGMVLPRFVQQALAGEDLTVHGDGEQTRCFTHVRDSARAMLLLLAHPGALGRTFNIGSSTPVAVNDLAARVIARTESSSGVVHVPFDEAYSPGFEELGLRQPDTSAVRDLTGWVPERGLDDAIDDVIAHLGAQMELQVLADAA